MSKLYLKYKVWASLVVGHLVEVSNVWCTDVLQVVTFFYVFVNSGNLF